MEYRKFEKHISDVLAAEQVHLDIDSLIHDIHKTKVKKRRAPFLWFVSIGLLFTVLAILFLNDDKTNINTAYKKTNLRQVSATKLVMSEGSTVASTYIQCNEKTESNQTDRNAINYSNKNVSASIHDIDVGAIQVSTPKLPGNTINDEQQTEFRQKNIIEWNHKIHPLKDIENNALQTLYPTKILWNTGKIICPSFARKNNLYVEIAPEAGMFIAGKKLVQNSTEVGSVYRLRDQNEKTLEGINAGLYIHLRKENLPFYLKSGISWSKLTEKMPLKYSYTRKDTTQGIISITVSQTGDTVTTIYGDIVTERKLSGNKIRHYSFTLWDIPIAAGAEKRFGQWSAGFEAGIMLNLTMKSEGNILTSDTSYTAINLPPSDFKSTLSVSYFGGLVLGRDFNRAGRIYLAARMRYFPESFSGAGNPIKQTYNFVGLNLGYIIAF